MSSISSVFVIPWLCFIVKPSLPGLKLCFGHLMTGLPLRAGGQTQNTYTSSSLVRTHITTYLPTALQPYLYVYIYIHIHTCIHACLRTYVRTYVHTYIHTYIHSVYIHILHTCTCIHTVYTYIPVVVYIHTLYIHVVVYRQTDDILRTVIQIRTVTQPAAEISYKW